MAQRPKLFNPQSTLTGETGGKSLSLRASPDAFGASIGTKIAGASGQFADYFYKKAVASEETKAASHLLAYEEDLHQTTNAALKMDPFEAEEWYKDQVKKIGARHQRQLKSTTSNTYFMSRQGATLRTYRNRFATGNNKRWAGKVAATWDAFVQKSESEAITSVDSMESMRYFNSALQAINRQETMGALKADDALKKKQELAARALEGRLFRIGSQASDPSSLVRALEDGDISEYDTVVAELLGKVGGDAAADLIIKARKHANQIEEAKIEKEKRLTAEVKRERDASLRIIFGANREDSEKALAEYKNMKDRNLFLTRDQRVSAEDHLMALGVSATNFGLSEVARVSFLEPSERSDARTLVNLSRQAIDGTLTAVALHGQAFTAEGPKLTQADYEKFNAAIHAQRDEVFQLSKGRLKAAFYTDKWTDDYAQILPIGMPMSVYSNQEYAFLKWRMGKEGQGASTAAINNKVAELIADGKGQLQEEAKVSYESWMGQNRQKKMFGDTEIYNYTELRKKLDQIIQNGEQRQSQAALGLRQELQFYKDMGVYNGSSQ